MNICSFSLTEWYRSSHYYRVTLPALDTWQSSPSWWQRLYLGWIGRSIWVRLRCFKMSALVPQPGLTMSRSILPPGTAINLIWWVKNSFDFLINICYDQLISKGRNSSGICFPPHSWQGCQDWPNSQLNTLAGGKIKNTPQNVFFYMCIGLFSRCIRRCVRFARPQIRRSNDAFHVDCLQCFPGDSTDE